jgi:zinc protease
VQDGERQVTVRRVGGTPLIYMAYHVPPARTPMRRTRSADLRAGRHARRPPAQARWWRSAWPRRPSASPSALAEPGALLLGAGLAPGQDIDGRARDGRLIEARGAEPVTAEELERARTSGSTAGTAASPTPSIGGRGLVEAIAQGDWRLFFLQRDQVRRSSRWPM